MAYSPVTVLMMATSPDDQHGANSAALQTNEVLMTAVVVSIGAAAYGQLAPWNRSVAFAVVLAVALAAAVAGLLVSGRLSTKQAVSVRELVTAGS